MPSVGPLSAGAGASAAGSPSWSDPGNITASDNNDAFQGGTGTGDRAALLATDFGAAVPDDSAIDGVLVEFEAIGEEGITLTNVWLVHAGSQIGTTDTTDSALPTLINTYASRGGATSKFGATLTSTIVNAPTFGVAFQINKSGGGNRGANFDHVRITIFYTETAQEIASNHISTTITMHSPGVAVGAVNVAAQHVAETTVPHQPGITPGAVSIAANHVAGTVEAHEPTVETSGQNIGMQHIAASVEAHQPGLTYAQSIGAQHIASALDVHEPGVSYAQTIASLHIAADLILHQPGISVGAALIGGEHFAETVILYEHGVTVGAVSIGMDHIAETVVLYEFVVSGGLVKTVQRVSRRRERYYSVIIEPPLGVYPRYRLDYDDINPSVTALSWRTGEGGWADATIGIAHPIQDEKYGQPLARPHLQRSLRYKSFAHVEIQRNGRVVFAGRMGRRQRGQAALVTGLSVPGYGVAATLDNPYINTSSTTTTTGILLKSIIANAAPHLRAASGDDWTDPAVSHAYNEFHGMLLQDALAQAVSEGTDSGRIVDWFVYEDQLVILRVREEPEQPDYVLPFDHRVASWDEDEEQMIGAVTHSRIVDGVETMSTTFETNDSFVQQHGFQRSKRLALGSVTEESALAIRKTYLRTNSEPIVSGAIEIGPDDVLEGPNGRVRPKELARRGLWVQVGSERMQMVVTTDYDATADVLRMEVGSFQPDFDTLIAALQQDRLQRQRGINSYGGRR